MSPQTAEDILYGCLVALTCLYIGAHFALSAYRKDWDRVRHFELSKVFDGSTFSGSLVLLAGIVDADVMKVIGNTKPYLLVAGVSGLIYSLHAFFAAPSAQTE